MGISRGGSISLHSPSGVAGPGIDIRISGGERGVEGDVNDVEIKNEFGNLETQEKERNGTGVDLRDKIEIEGSVDEVTERM